MGLIGLGFASWAGSMEFDDTTVVFSSIAMMGMMGYIFHSLVLFMMITFPLQVRKVLTVILLLWHIPEALLIGFFGMGTPEPIFGVMIHGGFSILILLSWYLWRTE